MTNEDIKGKTILPTDFVDKYLKLFRDEEQLNAVIDLMRQSFKLGTEVECDNCNELYK